jgi:hypothetical protein
MAHHIAELIHDAEAAKGQARDEKLRECRTAILELWKARHELPRGSRPFEDYDAIFRALANLDPENDVPRYYRPQRTPETREENEGTAQWLDLVEGLDSSARILINFCLARAGASASEKAREWIELVKGEASGQKDVAIIIRLTSMMDDLTESPKEDAERKMLEDRLGRLESFRDLADAAVSDISKLLASKSKPA